MRHEYYESMPCAIEFLHYYLLIFFLRRSIALFSLYQFSITSVAKPSVELSKVSQTNRRTLYNLIIGCLVSSFTPRSSRYVRYCVGWRDSIFFVMQQPRFVRGPPGCILIKLKFQPWGCLLHVSPQSPTRRPVESNNFVFCSTVSLMYFFLRVLVRSVI